MQTFLRMTFELSLAQKSVVDRKTLDSLTYMFEERKDELMKLREEVGELPGFKETLARCVDLKERLAKIEQ